jgi:DNA helicase-2/ATP-dependent DNA helicase PcrA
VLEAYDLDADADSVLVTTMHGAKGLEAECVYCTWLSSTFMPVHGRDPEEERRVLYVAMTRAKRNLVLTYPEGYDQLRHRRLGQEAMSPFLKEIIGRLHVFRATAAMIRTDPLPWQ